MMRYIFICFILAGCSFTFHDAKAGVVIEPAYNENQLDWVDPNTAPSTMTETYISQHGLTCKNQIFQIYHMGTYLPARKCQLPDGAWFTEPL